MQESLFKDFTDEEYARFLVDLAKAYEATDDSTAGGELREAARRLRGVEDRVKSAYEAGFNERVAASARSDRPIPGTIRAEGVAP